jgi:cobalt-zinc-cadmium efflux system membrane fusion protein
MSPTAHAFASRLLAALLLPALSTLCAVEPVPAPAPAAAPTATSEQPRTVTLQQEQVANLSIEAVKGVPFRAEKTATGRIAFNDDRTTPVFPPYAGHVVHLLAKPGDVVRQGDPLVELDAPDLVQAEADLWAALPAVAKAQSVLEHARRNEERQHRLFAGQAVAQKDWEQAQADVEAAVSDLTTAQAGLTGARDKVRLFGKSEAEITAIEGRHQVDRMIIVRAPIAGTVTTRKVGPGQYVKTDNADPLFTISDLSTMWLLADVYETDAPLVAIGQKVEVRLLAYPGEVFNAEIGYISPSVDPTTHRVGVRCDIDNPKHALKSDMFASFTIITATSASSPGVPSGAVVREGDHQLVWVAGKDGLTFTQRVVSTGLQQAGRIQVLSGLQIDEQVVAAGGIFLNEQ